MAKGKQGFTLIELIIVIAIAAVIITPLSIFLFEASTRTLFPEHYQIASSLLEGRLEEISGRRFNSVVNEGPTSFTGDFSRYSYQISFYYVDGSSLNSPSASPTTDYKRVLITVSRAGLPDVSAVTVVTNN
jgi:prepilin-type N-terminal cleavage/methylation domain-containing protein